MLTLARNSNVKRVLIVKMVLTTRTKAGISFFVSHPLGLALSVKYNANGVLCSCKNRLRHRYISRRWCVFYFLLFIRLYKNKLQFHISLDGARMERSGHSFPVPPLRF